MKINAHISAVDVPYEPLYLQCLPRLYCSLSADMVLPYLPISYGMAES